jgi:hypothetical protein
MNYVPMTFGMVLSRFFELMRSKWRVLIGVNVSYGVTLIVTLLVCMGPLFWRIVTLTQGGVQHPEFSDLAWYLLPLVVLYPLMIVLMVLYLPAVALVSLRANRNEAVSFGEAWGYAFSRFWRFLWLGIRQALLIGLPVLAGAALLLGGVAGVIALVTRGSGDTSAYAVLFPLGMLYYLVAAVYIIWLSIRFIFSSYAAVDEDLGAAKAMTRSWQLTQNNFWRILGSLIIVGLLLYAAQMVLMFVIYFIVGIGVVIGIAGHADQNPVLLSVLIGLGVLLYAVFIIIIVAVQQSAVHGMLAILYDDLCRRLEPGTEPQPPVYTGALPPA